MGKTNNNKNMTMTKAKQYVTSINKIGLIPTMRAFELDRANFFSWLERKGRPIIIEKRFSHYPCREKLKTQIPDKDIDYQLQKDLDRVEKIEACKFNIKETSRKHGIPIGTLRGALNRYGIEIVKVYKISNPKNNDVKVATKYKVF